MLSLSFQPMTAQLSMKAVLPLAKIQALSMSHLPIHLSSKWMCFVRRGTILNNHWIDLLPGWCTIFVQLSICQILSTWCFCPLPFLLCYWLQRTESTNIKPTGLAVCVWLCHVLQVCCGYIIMWKCYPHYWPPMQGNHLSLVDSPPDEGAVFWSFYILFIVSQALSCVFWMEFVQAHT